MDDEAPKRAAAAPAKELPRLPPANPPAEVTAPAQAAPVVFGVERAAPRRPASPERARRRIALATGLLLAVVAVAGVMLAARASDSTTDEQSAQGTNPSAPTTPLITASATTVPSTVVTLAPVTAPSTTPTTVAAAPLITGVFGGIDVFGAENDEFGAVVERCRAEQRIVFASLQAYVGTTNAVPDNPDVLVGSGWLEPHPQGWSPRWAFQGRDGLIYVVPVSGGACDV
ncbi:MAG TPA: hypothetical protein VE487_16055 [Ilumatobacter sp.]|nr:hypothetical protein [Ilumatobacter sp.]